MRDKSDRFGAVELSPRRDAPLLSQSVDALASPTVSLTLCVVSATGLRPMQKNISSNAMCEISLVLDDGGARQPWGTTGDPHVDRKRADNRSRSGSNAAVTVPGGVVAKTFKTKVVRTSLNPIWKMDVDFGDYNVESVLGVLIVVRHIEKMGLVKKDIGQVLIPMRDLLELKTQPTREQIFTLEATDEVNAREAQEGISNRKYGKVTVRFNSYGLTQSDPNLPNYTGLMADSSKDLRPTSLSEGSVTHEDQFSGDAPRSGSHNIQAEVKKLQSFHQSKPVPGEVWYAIQSQWIANWLLFVTKYRGKAEHNPGAIDNMSLIAEDLPDGVFVVRPNLTIKKDFRMINKQSWDYYVSLYGGGPAIEVPVPKDCHDTALWLSTLRLDEASRVGSGYFSSDSESG